MAKKTSKKSPKAAKPAPAKKAAAALWVTSPVAAPKAVVAAAPAPAKSAAPAPVKATAASTSADVSARAHQIWIAKGKPTPGTPLADWLQAERELGLRKS